jgi:hypothetical protein
MSIGSWVGLNSLSKAAVDTAGTPFLRAPTQRPATKRYSTPLPAGHCADGDSENTSAEPGRDPKMPQLPTCMWSSPTLCTFEPSRTITRSRPRIPLPPESLSETLAVTGDEEINVQHVNSAANRKRGMFIWLLPSHAKNVSQAQKTFRQRILEQCSCGDLALWGITRVGTWFLCGDLTHPSGGSSPGAFAGALNRGRVEYN